MKILIKLGESLEIGFADLDGLEEDGLLTVAYTKTEIKVEADWTDTSGRKGVIYCETFPPSKYNIDDLRDLF